MIYSIKQRQSYRTRITLPWLRRQPALCRQINTVLRELPGINAVDVRARSGSVILEHPAGPIEMAAVLGIIDHAVSLYRESGVSIRGIHPKALRQEPDGDRPRKSTPKDHVSGLTLVATGIYLLVLWAKNLFFTTIAPAPISVISRITRLPALVALGLSIPIQRQAIDNLKRTGKPDIGLISTALLYLSILFGNATTALVVFWLFNLSGWLESRIRARTRRAIRAMLQQKVTDVWLVKDGVEVRMSVDDLAPGDVISLRRGHTIPVDGTVVLGKALVNESVMTGERFPGVKNNGHHVLAGTIIDEGELHVCVDAAGSDTRLAAIIRLIEETESGTTPLQVTSQRFSEAIVPVSLSLALGTFLFTGSLIRAMAVLIITCPCAIRISTSVAISAAMGNAAAGSIFVKGGQYVEIAGKVNVLVFDKTGTLSDDIPEVSRVALLDKRFRADTILSLAAGSLRVWQHPMSRAVMEKAEAIGVPHIPCDQNDLVIGQGVRARVNGKEILVGSRRFMEKRGVRISRAKPDGGYRTHPGENVLFVARDQRLIGLIGVKSRLKENAQRALSDLRAMGVYHMVMLTGDGKAGAELLAETLSFDEIHWNQSPEDKSAWIAGWKKRHPDDVVAMVGDGINDTPAFARADLSMAIGQDGADVAVEYANIVLGRGDLTQVSEMIALGQKAVSVIRQDYALAIGLNSVGLVMTATGLISPFAGAFFHNVITMIVVGNSSRLLAYKRNTTDLLEGAPCG
jgi:cation-transporting P-type ATPase C